MPAKPKKRKSDSNEPASSQAKKSRASASIAPLPWSANEHALTWALLNEVEKPANLVVLVGQTDLNDVRFSLFVIGLADEPCITEGARQRRLEDECVPSHCVRDRSRAVRTKSVGHPGPGAEEIRKVPCNFALYRLQLLMSCDSLVSEYRKEAKALHVTGGGVGDIRSEEAGGAASAESENVVFDYCHQRVQTRIHQQLTRTFGVGV